MKGRLAVALALLLTGAASTARAQGNIDFAKLEIQTVKITDGVYVLMGGPAQGNILVSAGSDGLFLVDTMYAQMHDKIMAALAKIGPQQVRYIVNTHLHGDHTAGNEAMAKSGAVIVSHENMRKRMAAPQTNQPPGAALPALTYTDSITLHFNAKMPGPTIDLAISPADPERWVSTTANGIFLSVDGGGTWRGIDPKANVRLAWPEEDALYRIDPGGPVWVSADGGGTWEERGSTGGEPRELTAASADELYAALLDGTVSRSADGGATWEKLLTP